MNKEHITVGCIGQGFIGKNLADVLESKGLDVIRYALEEPYCQNKEHIATCQVVFIAVPTPTTSQGFDATILERVLPLVGTGNIAVIKSTILPGTTRRLQAMFPAITILHAPEFLREKFAAEDTAHPSRNIIGIVDEKARPAAELVLRIIPPSATTVVCQAEEAELIKYGSNCFLAMKVVYMNLLYDAVQTMGGNYEVVSAAIGADPRIGTSHMKVVDTSGHRGALPGRGAGGHCFPKDLAAFRMFYETELSHDNKGIQLLHAIEAKNISLLRDTNKDISLLREIYAE